MARKRSDQQISRRTFIKDAAAVGGGAMLAPIAINLAACGSGDEDGGAKDDTGNAPNADAIATGAVLMGLYGGMDAQDAAMRGLEKVDFSWLNSGDSVLIKIASNSGNDHPATTSPAALSAMTTKLFELGAGRVVLGEQSGIEAVRHTSDGVRVSSTRELLEGNGLLAAAEDAGAEIHLFDDQPYDDGFFEATLPADSVWTESMYLPKIIKEVDHIVYLPRIASHVLAGYTMGHKISIGWLRDDGRHHLHYHAENFYEKYTDVNYAEEIRDRHRLTFSLCEKVLLHAGPDTGTIHALDPMLVLASDNLANHDALAVSVFLHMNDTVPASGGGFAYSRNFANFANEGFATSDQGQLPWVLNVEGAYQGYQAHPFENGFSEDRALSRGFELTGGAPGSIAVVFDGDNPDGDLMDRIERHGAGIFEFA